MKARKAIAAVACAGVLVAGTAAATVAYFTDSEKVVNTFAVGKVAIAMDESDLATANPDDRTAEGNRYHLVPGQEYVKDPVVRVSSDSDACWLFVKVENGLEAIEDPSDTVAAQMAANGWSAVAGVRDVYAYRETVSAGRNVPVFESFKVGGSVTNDALAPYKDAQIAVTAYAVQAAGFGTAAAALEAAPFPTA